MSNFWSVSGGEVILTEFSEVWVCLGVQIMCRSVLKILFLKSLEAVEHFSYLRCFHPMTDRVYMIGQKRSLFSQIPV